MKAPPELAIPRSLLRSLWSLYGLSFCVMIAAAANASVGRFYLTIADEMQTTPQTIAGILGNSQTLLPIVVAVPIGILVDRRNNVRLVRVAMATIVVGSLITSVARETVLFGLARAIVTVGFIVALLAGLSLSAAMTRQIERGRAVAIVLTGLVAGNLIGGMSGFSPAEMSLPWQASQVALTFAGAVAWGISFALLKPIYAQDPGGANSTFSGKGSVRRWAGILTFAYTLTLIASSLFRTSALVLGAADPALAPVLQLATASTIGLVAIVVGGFVTDAGYLSRGRPGPLVVAIFACLAVLVLTLVVTVSLGAGLLLALTGGRFAEGIIRVAATSALVTYLPHAARGRWLGAVLSVGAIVEVAVPPITQGMFIKPEMVPALPTSVPLVAGILTAVAAALFFRSARKVQSEPERPASRLMSLKEPPPYFPEPANRNTPCPCGSGRKWKHCHGQIP